MTFTYHLHVSLVVLEGYPVSSAINTITQSKIIKNISAKIKINLQISILLITILMTTSFHIIIGSQYLEIYKTRISVIKEINSQIEQQCPGEKSS